MKRNRWQKRIAGLCLIVCLALLGGCGGTDTDTAADGGNETATEAAVQPVEQASQIEKETAAALIGELSSDEEVGPGYEWSIIAIAGSSLGKSPEAQAVYQRFQENMRLQVKRTGGVLSEDRPTENAKAAIALELIGADPTDVEGYDLLDQLEETEAVSGQGINGPIWALIASASSKRPLEAKQSYLDELLEAQDEDGAITYDGKTADVDITAMAVQALAAFAEEDEAVAEAAASARDWLSGKQKKEGDYGNAESTAQVILAVACLGEDPVKAEDFIKEGSGLWDGMMLYRVEDGFSHEKGDAVNTMATEQSLCALDAIRLAEEGQGLYY